MDKKHLCIQLQIKVRPKGLHKSLPPDPWPLTPRLSTLVESPLQIKLFLQNEPKFRKVKLNVNKVLTSDYEQLDTWSIRKNEPKRTQNEPKFKKVKMNVTPIITVDYENKSNWAICENEAKTNPIQTQFNPISAPKMLPRMKINTRPNTLAHYPGFRFFAADHGPNLSCFEDILFALGLIFSEKNQQLREIPDKAGAALCRFVYIKKILASLSGARDNNSRFSIEN
jgi:hypothetical protein